MLILVPALPVVYFFIRRVINRLTVCRGPKINSRYFFKILIFQYLISMKLAQILRYPRLETCPTSDSSTSWIYPFPPWKNARSGANKAGFLHRLTLTPILGRSSPAFVSGFSSRLSTCQIKSSSPPDLPSVRSYCVTQASPLISMSPGLMRMRYVPRCNRKTLRPVIPQICWQN